MAEEARRRVKVYVLKPDGSWDDRGTGHVVEQQIEDRPGFLVISEEDDHTCLLSSKIFRQDVFQRQVDTIVTWVDPEDSEEIALSFQEVFGASELWERICSIQGKNPSQGMERSPSPPREIERGGKQQKIPLPLLANLDEIASIFCNYGMVTRDNIVHAVMEEEWLKKFCDTFSMCEDCEDTASLHTIFKIVKSLMLLNEPNLIEVMITDEYIMDVMGALEYDPDLNNPIKHREYLRKPNLFKQPVEIQDKECLERIHANFRLSYLKDVVMARFIDDLSFGTIRSLTTLNNQIIIRSIQEDKRLLKELFRCCRKELGVTKFRQGVMFLQELCDIAKQLPEHSKSQFYGILIECGFLASVGVAISDNDYRCRNAGIDALTACILHHPSPVRRDAIQKSPVPPGQQAGKGSGFGGSGSGGFGKSIDLLGKETAASTSNSGAGGDASPSSADPYDGPLDGGVVGILVRTLVSPRATSEKPQLYELLRMLLDSPSGEDAPEHSTFLEVFYDRPFAKLVSLFGFDYVNPWAVGNTTTTTTTTTTPTTTATTSAPAPAPAPAPGDSTAAVAAVDAGQTAPLTRRERIATDSARGHAMELLGFCVSNHGWKIKHFMLRNPLLPNILKLINHRDKYLRLGAIRFLRACVACNDIFYNKSIISKDLFGPLFAELDNCGHRENLIMSAICELFDHVRHKNIKAVIAYINDKYADKLAQRDHIEVFHLLKVKHEQNLEYEQSGKISNHEETDKKGTLATGVAANAEKQPSTSRGGPNSSDMRMSRLELMTKENKQRMERMKASEREESYFDGDDGDDDESARNGSGSGSGGSVHNDTPRPDQSPRPAGEGSGASAGAGGSTGLTMNDDDDDDDDDFGPPKRRESPPSKTAFGLASIFDAYGDGDGDVGDETTPDVSPVNVSAKSTGPTKLKFVPAGDGGSTSGTQTDVRQSDGEENTVGSTTTTTTSTEECCAAGEKRSAPDGGSTSSNAGNATNGQQGSSGTIVGQSVAGNGVNGECEDAKRHRPSSES